mmetsp:Transcript_118553/g.335391  ORF Transcript_118553/g.335391 Transcript_118553/m.335391 type:complete len:136 (-) Transcript_118553:83-490(-)
MAAARAAIKDARRGAGVRRRHRRSQWTMGICFLAASALVLLHAVRPPTTFFLLGGAAPALGPTPAPVGDALRPGAQIASAMPVAAALATPYAAHAAGGLPAPVLGASAISVVGVIALLTAGIAAGRGLFAFLDDL